MKELLLAKWRLSKKCPEALAGHSSIAPHFPYVWNWYIALLPKVDWITIRAWAELTGSRPTGWECELLLKLDRLRN